MSFQKLDDLGRKLEALEHALAILGADEATHMAVGGGDKRAEAMANLAGMYHAQATAPEIADLIEAARPDVLIKGADYAESEVVGGDFVKSYGGEVRLAQLVDGYSTTAAIARMQEKA